jgi:HEAT repeat protein
MIDKELEMPDADEAAVEALVDALYAAEGEEAKLISIATSLKKYGKTAIQPIVKLLQDNRVSSLIKRYAAWALWEIPDDRAVESLLSLLNDADAVLVESAINTLSRIGNHQATEPIQNILRKSVNVRLRAAAASALGFIRDEYAIDPLIAALKTDASEEVRRLAAQALSYYRGEKVVKALVEALYDKDQSVPIWATDAIKNTERQLGLIWKRFFTRHLKSSIKLSIRCLGNGWMLQETGRIKISNPC